MQDDFLTIQRKDDISDRTKFLFLNTIDTVASSLMLLGTKPSRDKVNGYRSNYFGICKSVHKICFDLKASDDTKGQVDYYIDKACVTMFLSWPKSSGGKSFPIPSSTIGVANSDAYDKSKNDGTAWSKNTTYGTLRRELAIYCSCILADALTMYHKGVANDAKS